MSRLLLSTIFIMNRSRNRHKRRGYSLTGCEWERLSVIPECMAFFIEKNAITPEEYLETKGQDYRNTPFLQVYGHDGEACPVCGEILCRSVLLDNYIDNENVAWIGTDSYEGIQKAVNYLIGQGYTKIALLNAGHNSRVSHERLY